MRERIALSASNPVRVDLFIHLRKYRPARASREASVPRRNASGRAAAADICRVRRLIATLLAALATTVTFAFIQSNRHLEDSPFIHALFAFSTVVFALAVASCLSLRGSLRSSVALGVVAFLLVPLLFAAYVVLHVVSVCIIGGQTCYS